MDAMMERLNPDRDYHVCRRTIEIRREQRQDGEGAAPPVITGYAALFAPEQVDFGEWVERLAPGAFTRTLAEHGADGAEPIFALWAHDDALNLGSTRTHLTTLEEDDIGLRFELAAARLTREQFKAVEDGDMRMSFAFIPQRPEWDDTVDPPVRTIYDLDLFEISLVTFPAQPKTSAQLRAYQAWKQSRPAPEPRLRQRLARELDLTGALMGR